MSQAQEQTVDLNAILKEVAGEVDQLIKTEEARLDALKKNEESSKKEESSMSKKEESSMKKEESSMKKDEGSGFESPAPEASASSSAAPAESAAAPGAEDQGESLQSMVQGLDDDMLHELMQVVQMEMEARSKSAAPAPDASMSQPPAASPAPAADASAMKSEASMMHKKELDEVKEKLAKSEEQSKNLEKAVTAMTDLMEKMVNRPVTKAVTDIRNVDFVDKGEKDLKKNEDANLSDEDFHKKARKIANDKNELGKLTKNEREALSAYFVTKKRSPEVLKLISK